MDRREFIKISGVAAIGAATKTKPGKDSESAKGGMEYRINPTNGDKVSLLGYGCMRLPMIDKDGGQVIDQEAVNELVDYAMAHGINYFDTSPAYLQGQSEKAAGIALAKYPRSSYFLATKLSNFRISDKEASIALYRDSLKQLNTDYFDYYLLHNIGRNMESFKARYIDNGILDFVKAEREAGHIRNLGFSFHGIKEMFDHFLQMHDSGEVHWDFCQIQMNYKDWTHADPSRNVNADYLYEELDKREIPIVIMEPLLGGRLASVPDGIAKQMKEREPDRSVASWAFRFCGSYPRVLCILSGMSAMDPLLDNLETFSDFKPLNEEELDFLERMAKWMEEYPLVNCNYCNYCMPCPWGVDIPGILRHYNESVATGLYPQTAAQKDYKKLKRAFLVSYDRAMESIRQADHCIGCKECLQHCPQSINIPDELQRINHYVERLKQDTL